MSGYKLRRPGQANLTEKKPTVQDAKEKALVEQTDALEAKHMQIDGATEGKAFAVHDEKTAEVLAAEREALEAEREAREAEAARIIALREAERIAAEKIAAEVAQQPRQEAQRPADDAEPQGGSKNRPVAVYAVVGLSIAALAALAFFANPTKRQEPIAEPAPATATATATATPAPAPKIITPLYLDAVSLSLDQQQHPNRAASFRRPFTSWTPPLPETPPLTNKPPLTSPKTGKPFETSKPENDLFRAQAEAEAARLRDKRQADAAAAAAAESRRLEAERAALERQTAKPAPAPVQMQQEETTDEKLRRFMRTR